MNTSKPPRIWVSNENPKTNDILRVRAQIEHAMETGLRTDPVTGQLRPRHILHYFEARLGEKLVFIWEPGTSIAQNPYIEFTFKAQHSGPLNLLWKDDRGTTLTASKTITVS